MPRPFEGIQVIDLSYVLAGPFSTYQLVVPGAQVIKIESPEEGDMLRVSGADRMLNQAGMSGIFMTQNSNKRSLAHSWPTLHRFGALRQDGVI